MCQDIVTRNRVLANDDLEVQKDAICHTCGKAGHDLKRCIACSHVSYCRCALCTTAPIHQILDFSDLNPTTTLLIHRSQHFGVCLTHPACAQATDRVQACSLLLQQGVSNRGLEVSQGAVQVAGKPAESGEQAVTTRRQRQAGLQALLPLHIAGPLCQLALYASCYVMFYLLLHMYAAHHQSINAFAHIRAQALKLWWCAAYVAYQLHMSHHRWVLTYRVFRCSHCQASCT